MNAHLVKFERNKHPYKLPLMINSKIADMLKKYSKGHKLTKSCLIENLIFRNLEAEKMELKLYSIGYISDDRTLVIISRVDSFTLI
ncbi:hypothetical protein PM10SUCC1_19370 [Propionigenium maris DSM 9537]|uniref:Uncharacterized protein n=1 Tax=Propionigenium maris DSM 9537 TaxID=1123000 RepID=A0A9W6GJR0_9FUSO|nr:hypothetical protein PM10SUCC1_19370 [Propionigenium maris DSM 9537]